MNFKILGLAASLRRASIHRGLLRAAHEVCPQGMACESFDLGRIPHFNADVEAEGDPEPVRELKERIRAYGAVLIASPEYDYAIPGVLTTALDWCLRSPSPFRHKPVGMAGEATITAISQASHLRVLDVLLLAYAEGVGPLFSETRGSIDLSGSSGPDVGLRDEGSVDRTFLGDL